MREGGMRMDVSSCSSREAQASKVSWISRCPPGRPCVAGAVRWWGGEVGFGMEWGGGRGGWKIGCMG